MGLVVAPGLIEVVRHHLDYQLRERDPGLPPQDIPGLRGVAQQGFHLRRAEVFRIDGNDTLPDFDPRRQFSVAGFHRCRLIQPGPAPFQFQLQLPRGGIDELPHRVLDPGGNHEVLRLFLLQHKPLGGHVILRVAPIAPGIEVAEIEAILQALADIGQPPGDLAGDEGFAAAGGFMVEEDTVAGEHPVGFAVIDRDPVGIQLRRGIGGSVAYRHPATETRYPLHAFRRQLPRKDLAHMNIGRVISQRISSMINQCFQTDGLNAPDQKKTLFSGIDDADIV
jgi:hypothetical protein